MFPKSRWLLACLAAGIFVGSPTAAAAATHQVWLSPKGRDANPGTQSRPLRSLSQAWRRIPAADRGVWHLHLADGDYRANAPIYWDEHAAAVLIHGSGGSRRAVLPEVNAYGLRSFSLVGVRLVGGGDVFHCEKCIHVLVSHVIAVGTGQETIKINQSTDVTVADSDVSGANDNAFDAVAVQHLRLLRNHFHNAEDWCAYAKGGSEDVVVRGNLFNNCGTGGFTAGQGTGFQFMSWPFVHWEASDVLVENNSVRNVQGAAFGVNGGANVLIRNNLASNVGRRSHVLEVTWGLRSCDGEPGDPGRGACADYLSRGGWGTTAVSDGTNEARIPNSNVLIYDNVISNPDGHSSQWQVFQVPGPADAEPGSGVPSPLRADDALRIVGNVIWDGGPSHELGLGGESCLPGSSCAAATVRANNQINTRRPVLVALSSGWLARSGWVASSAVHSAPVPAASVRVGSEPSTWSSWP
ncbi:MAG: right-handed parallel beta-helix repeat-containing protein [Actinomycetes bacterium]